MVLEQLNAGMVSNGVIEDDREAEIVASGFSGKGRSVKIIFSLR